MDVLDRARADARARPARVVFPEDDARLVEAARLLDGLVEAVPLAGPSQAQMRALVDGRGLREGVARRMLSRPLMRAAAMVAAGEADAMVAGAVSPTRRVIEAASLVLGPAPGVETASSFFVMVFPDGREMVWADCAVTVAPDARQLADIARAAQASARALLGEARVALLSYSTGASGVGPSVERVAEAARLAGLPGPVQADAALDAAIAARKGVGGGAGGGDANVLVFPSLDAGNIAYKLAQSLAGARALGPILQGFAAPVCDLSRGAAPREIAEATLLTLALRPG
ncbi:MAG: phosphate acyltransferase [Paracoccaceae bacterium]